MKFFLQLLLLILLATGLGTAANLVGPWKIPWTEDHSVAAKAAKTNIQPVTIEQVETYIETGEAFLLDARSPEKYDEGHLPGAFMLPIKEFAQYWPDVQPFLDPPDTPYVVYCSGEDCDESLLLGKEIIAQGYPNAHIFVGGFSAWQAAGKDIE